MIRSTIQTLNKVWGYLSPCNTTMSPSSERTFTFVFFCINVLVKNKVNKYISQNNVYELIGKDNFSFHFHFHLIKADECALINFLKYV